MSFPRGSPAASAVTGQAPEEAPWRGGTRTLCVPQQMKGVSRPFVLLLDKTPDFPR